MPYRRKRHPHRNHNPTGSIKPLNPSTVEQILYGAPLPDIHAKQRLEEARSTTAKEKEKMPDIQTALAVALQKQQQQTALNKVLDEWADDDKPTTKQAQPQPQEKPTMTASFGSFNITNNVSRVTFNYVRDNPGRKYREILDALVAQGFNEASVTSLLSQFRRCGIMVRDDAMRFTTTTNDYATPSHSKLKAVKKARQAQKAAKHKAPTMPLPPLTLPENTPHPAAGLAALNPQPMQPIIVTNDVEHILNTLPIKQARALYEELKKLFGG